MSTAHSFPPPTLQRWLGSRLWRAIPLACSLIALSGFVLIPFLVAPVNLSAYLTGLAFLICGILVIVPRAQDAASQVFTVLAAAYALGVMAIGQSGLPAQLSSVPAAAIALAGGATLHLALIYPGETFSSQRYRTLRWMSYLPTLALWLYLLVQGRFPESVRQLPTSEFASLGFATLALGVFSINAFARWRRAPSPLGARQARNLAIASLTGIPVLIFMSLSSTTSQTPPNTGWLALLAIFPVVTGYSLIRYQLSIYTPRSARLVFATLLTLLIFLGYLALATGISLLLGSSLPAGHPLVTGLAVAMAVIAILPLRDYLHRQVERAMLRGGSELQDTLQEFSQESARLLEIAAVAQRLRQAISEKLQPALLHIHLYDATRDLYLPSADESGKASTSLRFPARSALALHLAKRREPLILGNGETLPADLQGEQERLKLLGAGAILPLAGIQDLIGWIALGDKKDRTPYHAAELAFVTALSSQASQAIERLQEIDNLKRRVREMDVLARLSHGLNVTLAFDDILELIYAQTNYLIPTRNFRVTLVDQRSGDLYHAFFLEDDERWPAREKTPLPGDQGLESQVIEDRRQINVGDYRQECRRRSAIPDMPGVYAWLGVPLNAGDETLGSICVGNHEPAQPFSQRQVELLTAIADQTAGAITKIRLLEETERRARQLATLNEIGRGLSSTLEITPLLRQILDSAAEILDCEAGSLFMQAEHTGEMVFEVTAGPVAQDLVGKRLPSGSGFASQALETGKPVIANDVRNSPGWFDAADKETGFVTRDLLAVPMSVKGRAIGVIEVINKRDGSPFNLEDQNLLATFASQAAVAIDNARLYTQTDAALTARLEEMAVMQRIDRELSASLDLPRVLEITLDWSLRQLKADSGFIGLVETIPGQESGTLQLSVARQSGQPVEIPQRAIPLAPASHPLLWAAISNGQPQRVQDSSIFEFTGNPEARPGEPPASAQATRSGLLVPIRRTNQTIGLLALESPTSEGFGQEATGFLSRLCDHAAIAISNANLYADLQAANIAKSEFVSLVSHELKTPMTSIKGYADLLAQGAVGPINEVQANFLNTIRSNVNRMATLVSDLADVSRIEANRLRLEFSAVDIAAAAAEVVRSSQAQLDEKGQRLELDLSAELPPAWCDQNRLVQVLANLTSNAIKYTPQEGSITLSAALVRSAGELQEAAEMIQVCVRDTGYGISEADQKKIFQKFFRSEDERIREAPGTGLGLNITRHLVEMQGGSIWFESQLGTGSAFYFTIPPAHA